MNLIQIMEINQMTIQDFIKNREKVAGKSVAIKELTSALESFDKDTQKRVLTPFGSEILSQESHISTKTKPLTLRDKLMELEALSKRVMDYKLRETMAYLDGEDDGEELTESDEVEVEEDLSFGASQYLDRSTKPIEPDDGNGEEPRVEPAAPTAKPAGSAGDEPLPDDGE